MKMFMMWLCEYSQYVQYSAKYISRTFLSLQSGPVFPESYFWAREEINKEDHLEKKIILRSISTLFCLFFCLSEN